MTLEAIVHQWGLWIIFLMATFEATPIFGFLSPGLVVVSIGGFFARLGVLDLGSVFLVAFAASFLGDLLSYVFGKGFGDDYIYSFIEKYGKYFLLKQEYYDKTKKVVKKHTGKSLVLGRFNSVTRAFAAFVAGTSNVGAWRFLSFNVVGAAAWTATYVGVGYIFGESYKLINDYITNTLLILAVIIVLGYYSYKKWQELQE